jgi:hypothetical protein
MFFLQQTSETSVRDFGLGEGNCAEQPETGVVRERARMQRFGQRPRRKTRGRANGDS